MYNFSSNNLKCPSPCQQAVNARPLACLTVLSALANKLKLISLCSPGLALVIPSGQSLIADFHSPLQRGMAFGVLYLTSASGGMLGAIFATNMGKYSGAACLAHESRI